MTEVHLRGKTHTWSCQTSGNYDNARRRRNPSWWSVCSWEACCVGVGVERQAVALGAGKLQQSQIVTSTLTFELPVDHHLLRSEGLLRRPDAHHVPGGVAAQPAGGRVETSVGALWLLLTDLLYRFAVRRWSHLLTQEAEVRAQQGLISVPLQRGPPSSWEWSHTDTRQGHEVLTANGRRIKTLSNQRPGQKCSYILAFFFFVLRYDKIRR